MAEVLEQEKKTEEAALPAFQVVIKGTRRNAQEASPGAAAEKDAQKADPAVVKAAANAVPDPAPVEYFSGIHVRAQDGYFIRDLEHDLVLCPAGNLMRRKCSKSNGYTRYMCKAACRKCRDFRRCYSGKKKWKEIDFPEGAVLVRCRNWNR